MSEEKMTIISLMDDPRMAVTYLVFASSQEALVVDPGQPVSRITQELENNGKRCGAILLTHGHYDHICGVDELCAAWGDPPIYLHEADHSMLTDPMTNVSALFYHSVTCDTKPVYLQGGETLTLCGLTIRVISTPGHTEGGVCYYISHGDESLLLSGDTLFNGNVGRWDFFGGDRETLLCSLRFLLSLLPPDTRVYPGHGDPTTLRREERENPFLKWS